MSMFASSGRPVIRGALLFGGRKIEIVRKNCFSGDQKADHLKSTRRIVGRPNRQQLREVGNTGDSQQSEECRIY